MQKYALLCFFVFAGLLSGSQPTPTKDSAIQISNVKITVTSTNYSATTQVELELFNPNAKVLDGEINFSLAEGQMINEFKLDINGHMRDGAVIEKQQARVAYENIVRRKVDPGLLELTSPNHYRIRVYPVPANGKRYVSFAVRQLLIPNRQQLDYVFPIYFSNPVKDLAAEISVTSEELPFTGSGLLQGRKFTDGNSKQLSYQTQNVGPNSSLVFSIPIKNPVSVCQYLDDCGSIFLGRITMDSLPIQKKSPASVTVFWDVSASAEKRDRKAEILFLETYLRTYQLQQVVIVTFAIDVVNERKFSMPSNRLPAIKRFLEAQKTDGGTRLNQLHCDRYPADEYLLFSDGQNTFGEGILHTNDKPVFSIQSAVSANTTLLNKISRQTGGKLVNLSLLKAEEALASLQQPQWKLVTDEKQTSLFNIDVLESGLSLFVKGKNNTNADSLILKFVYAEYSMNVVLRLKNTDCQAAQLSAAASIFDWQLMIGKIKGVDSLHQAAMQQNVVTATTSLIVLDAVEDYYQYQITPPKELLEEFKNRYPALPDKREEKQKEKEILVYQKLQEAVREYNEKISWWDPSLAMLRIKPLAEKPKAVVVANEREKTNLKATDQLFASKSNALSEVVVVGYASSRRRQVTGASSSVSGSQLSSASTVQQALQGRVAGLNITGTPGAMTNITLRGSASIRGGSEPLYILDGVRVDAATVMNMSTLDIDNISVLKDASAAALYGSGAANGVIVVTTKRGHYTPTKQLVEEEEAGDELLDSIKEVNRLLQYDRYIELKQHFSDAPAFYFRMADYFFQQKLSKEALRILSNLAEIRTEDHQLLRTIGYVLEEWNDYPNAIEVYKAVLKTKEEEPQSYRDLALAYAMNGDRGEAIGLLYKVLAKDWAQYEGRYQGLREILMTELNTLVHAGTKNESAIDKSLMQLLPVDLRVVVDWNKDETDIDLHVVEPGGEECSYSNRKTKSGGRISKDFTQGYGPEEYEVRKAQKGRYKIKVDYYGDSYQKLQVPSFIKLTIFKNYGKANQTVFIKTIKLEGGERMIDLAEIKF